MVSVIMWAQAIPYLIVVHVVMGDQEMPGFVREMSEGVESRGFKIIYGDEDMTIINQVVSEAEKGNAFKKRVHLNEAIKPLPAQDVKCLMSVDRYCSKEMGLMKSVLIQAVKDDCVKCSVQQKDQAGKVIASMMAHDPVAWKVFLTRSALQIKPREQPKKREEIRLKDVGEPEDVIRSPSNSYIMPGVQVRVKRYVAEKIP
ncbi:unnamed protein product [Spodoptera littoralis]|uniref:Uncharacterized protein n=1 Tax=Spodoptera littoralis TaxID=7109 RepID=A0A9P0I6H9_SPOLI|nr:unnamed protein product [Spodoptera littoralis]CAH1640295.1 unnamed protein product [Spodoptera littoralis]